MAVAPPRQTPPEDAGLLLAGIAASCAAFIVCAYIAFATPAAVDDALLRALRSVDDPATPRGPAWLLEAMADFTALAGWPVVTLATAAIACGLVMRRSAGEAALLLAVSIGHSILVETLKGVFDRPRPDLVPTLTGFANLSFPSGHSASAGALYLAIALLLARRARDRGEKIAIFSLAAVMIVLIAASRVYLGVHYPTDAVAGVALGTGWTCLVFLIGNGSWRAFPHAVLTMTGSRRKTVRPDDMGDAEISIVRSESETKGRYVIRLDGHEAELTYSRAGAKRIIIDHTGVPDALGGKGLGGLLVRRAVEDARKEGKTVVPLCTFAKGYIGKHPELQDVLDR